MNTNLSFFADENISPALINWINQYGYNITGVKREKIEGISDLAIIERCFKSGDIILTHDNGFGKIIFTSSIPFFSIIYLRPGHFDGNFHIPTMISIFKNKQVITAGTLIIG